MSVSSRIGNIAKLKAPWKGVAPFIYANHHVDKYPKAYRGGMGVDPKDLKGRKVGQDMSGESGTGWNMYMSTGPIPGFPAHPHRGFETVSILTSGTVDHADSTGAGARYQTGDVQWVTAGAGVRHSEMMPMLNDDKPNHMELYQLWLNLPAKNKFAPPQFCMFWKENVPIVQPAPGVSVTVVAGAYEGVQPPNPPRASYASEPRSDLAIWIVSLDAGASVALPPANDPKTLRTLYVHGDGACVSIVGETLETEHALEVAKPTDPLTVTAETQSKILVLQSTDIGEPVVVKGPFVMNTDEQIKQAYADYKATHFGWEKHWNKQDPVYAKDEGRFADFGDGVKSRPPVVA